MRITSIISSFADAIARFDNAGFEMVRALLLGEPRYQSVYQTRLQVCAGPSVAELPSGDPGATVQSWLRDVAAKPGDTNPGMRVGLINASLAPADSHDPADGGTQGSARGRRLGLS